MLLTHLHETLSKKVKTADALQKLLDVADAEGLEAVSATEVMTTSGIVNFGNMITAGTLPFRVIPGGPANVLQIDLPTLTSFKGLEGLTVERIDFCMTSTAPSKLQSLKGMPKTTKLLKLQTPKLTSLEGLNLQDSKSVLELRNCSALKNLEHATAEKIRLVGEQHELRLNKPWSDSLKTLDLEYFNISTGLPWLVMIPKHVDVLLRSSTKSKLTNTKLPREIEDKIIRIQRAGGTRADVFEIQQDLIEAGLDDLAEL